MSRIIGLVIDTPVKKSAKRTPKGEPAKPGEKEADHGKAGDAEATAGDRR